MPKYEGKKKNILTVAIDSALTPIASFTEVWLTN